MNNPPLSEQTAQQLIARIAIPPRPQILTEIFFLHSNPMRPICAHFLGSLPAMSRSRPPC